LISCKCILQTQEQPLKKSLKEVKWICLERRENAQLKPEKAEKEWKIKIGTKNNGSK